MTTQATINDHISAREVLDGLQRMARHEGRTREADLLVLAMACVQRSLRQVEGLGVRRFSPTEVMPRLPAAH